MATGKARKTRSADNAQPAERRTDPSRIIDAAIVCFRKYGPLKVSMDDIAKAAQVGRQTVYRSFRTRTELLDAVAARRLEELAAKVRPLLATCTSFEDALIRGSIETMRLARRDRLFVTVLESASDNGVERYLIEPKSPILGHMLSVWAPVFAQARARGELRADVSDTDVANWLRAVHLILLLRDDLKDEGQATLLRTFVMPSLVPARKP